MRAHRCPSVDVAAGRTCPFGAEEGTERREGPRRGVGGRRVSRPVGFTFTPWSSVEGWDG